MKKLLVLLVALFVMSYAALAQKSKWIGYKFEPVNNGKALPNGWTDIGGAIISNIEVDPLLAIGRLRKGANEMLWFERSTGQDSNGVTGWEVRDVLEFPNMKKNQDLLYGGAGECYRNKKLDASLVVYADFLARSKSYKVLKAWRANQKTQKFEPILIKGVKCVYDEP